MYFIFQIFITIRAILNSIHRGLIFFPKIVNNRRQKLACCTPNVENIEIPQIYSVKLFFQIVQIIASPLTLRCMLSIPIPHKIINYSYDPQIVILAYLCFMPVNCMYIEPLPQNVWSLVRVLFLKSYLSNTI